MHRYIFLIFISILFIFYHQALGQSLSKDKAVLSPYVEIDKLSEQEGPVVRKYMPFDDMTLLITTFGALVYEKKHFQITMYPIALTDGNVNLVDPQATTLMLQFYFKSESESSDKYSFEPQTITFLIDGERHQKKILGKDTGFLEGNSIYLRLINADSVRARIEGKNKNHEIDMSKEIRSTLSILLSNITPSSE